MSAADQGERAMTREAVVAKGKRRRSGGGAVKECVLTWGDLASCLSSLPEVVARLRLYLLGWKGYYRLAQSPRIWQTLDEWLRHRVRAVQLKQ